MALFDREELETLQPDVFRDVADKILANGDPEVVRTLSAVAFDKMLVLREHDPHRQVFLAVYELAEYTGVGLDNRGEV